MGRNKRFENILDECLQLLLTGDGTVEQCLQRYPEYARELEPLLRTAMSVNQAIDVKPSPEFRARARYQLQIKMAQTKAPRRVSFFNAQPRWVMATLGVLLVFVLGTGTVWAADSSMPGNPLYPVKLATENVLVKLAGSDVKKAQLYAAYADRRLTEMSQMVEKGETKKVEAAAKRFNENVARMSNIALAKPPEAVTMIAQAPVAAPAATPAPLKTRSADKETQPPAMAGSLEKTFRGTEKSTVTAPETPAKDRSPSLTKREDKKESSSNDREKLKQAIKYYAASHPEELRKMLESDKVPESVKPAVRRALYAAEHGYQQALKDLDD